MKIVNISILIQFIIPQSTKHNLTIYVHNLIDKFHVCVNRQNAYIVTRMHSSGMRTARSSSRPRGVSPPGTPRTRHHPPGSRHDPRTRHPSGSRHPLGADTPRTRHPPPMWTESQTPVKI